MEPEGMEKRGGSLEDPVRELRPALGRFGRAAKGTECPVLLAWSLFMS